MRTTELLEVLKDQRNNLNQFHEIVLMKQRALIMNDIKGIEGAIMREEKMINKVENCEKQRVQLILSLKEKLNLDYPSHRMTDFILKAGELLDAKIKREFERELEIIEKLVSVIQQTNEQNQFLISNARNFIRKIIEAVAQGGKQSILDRKI
jgi:flagellar biosynthesis/type III secretory pathway chaperone